MASKIILDAPGLLEEQLITLTEACKEFPRKAARPTLERWARRGSRGTVLETILVCGKRYTSKEAVARFIRNQLQTEPERESAPRQRGMSQREIAEASKKFGLPEPKTNGEGGAQ